MSTKINKLLLKDKKNFKTFEFKLGDNENEFLNFAAEYLKGGVDICEFVSINVSSGTVLQIARKLRDLCGVFGALLVIRDRIDIAKLADADGITLDNETILPSEAVKLTEGRLIIGYHGKKYTLIANEEVKHIDFIVSNTPVNTDIKVFKSN